MINKIIISAFVILSMISCNSDDDSNSDLDIANLLTIDNGTWAVVDFQHRETENDEWVSDSLFCFNDDLWQFTSNGNLNIYINQNLCEGQTANDIALYNYEVVPNVGYNLIVNGQSSLETIELLNENSLIVTYNIGTVTNTMGRRVFSKVQ
ncbi:hypothetical protein [Patiriisocius marinus]|uniref:hypothetical protein n=1 Tax=Patiriisocius marinus TaxID=1397112 RepID=UPI00232C8A1B|nr:hypothetical protein [Patiriisocius marinus]